MEFLRSIFGEGKDRKKTNPESEISEIDKIAQGEVDKLEGRGAPVLEQEGRNEGVDKADQVRREERGIDRRVA